MKFGASGCGPAGGSRLRGPPDMSSPIWGLLIWGSYDRLLAGPALQPDRATINLCAILTEFHDKKVSPGLLRKPMAVKLLSLSLPGGRIVITIISRRVRQRQVWFVYKSDRISFEMSNASKRRRRRRRKKKHKDQAGAGLKHVNANNKQQPLWLRPQRGVAQISSLIVCPLSDCKTRSLSLSTCLFDDCRQPA